VQQAELCLIGHTPTVERIHQVAAAAALAITPLDDLRGSAAYRRQMVQVQVRRTLAKVFDLKVE
jgi:carbon-monoxide dehydrogenase medium subunit